MSKKFGVRFNGFSISDVISLVKQTEAAETAAQAATAQTDSGGYNPPANLKIPFPVSEGTVNGYGKATWIPDGYPANLIQPYLTPDGRLVLRPLIPAGLGNDLNNPNPVALAYVLAALQAAISTYSTMPYNSDYNMPNLENGRADIVNSLMSTISTPAKWLVARRASSGDINWLIPPPSPSGLEDIQSAAVKYIPAVTNALLNTVVPGLGTKLASITGTTTNPNVQGSLTAQVDSQYGSLVPTTENSLLSGSSSNLMLYAIVAIVIIIIILMATR